MSDWMIFDDLGNAFDCFHSRVAANVALRQNPDCFLLEYDDAGLALACWMAHELPPFTTELTRTTVDAWLT